MSDTFTASTGRTVAIKSRSITGTALEVSGLGTRTTVDLRDVATLREFFLHEAGIWVDPETGAHVYRRPGDDDEGGRCIFIVAGESAYFVWEEMVSDQHLREGIKARYFAAHPEPKPWHDAKPGEVWVITTENVADEVAVQRADTGDWQYNDGLVFCDNELKIETARRIWPEVTP